MIVDSGKYYLYRHIRLDTNVVFYIGIGTKLKSDSYYSKYIRAFSKDYRNRFWKSIIAKTDYFIEIILESDNYDFIQEKEIEFILLYGRKNLGKGTLCNLNDGGGSNNKMIVSEDTRKKMSISKKGRIVPEYHKIKLRELYKGIRPCKLAIANHLKSKLTPISQYDKIGNWIRDFNSLKEAKNTLNLKNHSVISAALQGRTKTAGGYKWKYKNK